jgi:hypothetical protein
MTGTDELAMKQHGDDDSGQLRTDTRARPADDGAQDRAEATDAGPPFALCSGVGRLIEVRLWHLFCASDLLAMSASMDGAARQLSSPAIIIADHRRGRPFSAGVADEWSRCMRGFKANVLLSAILLEPNNGTYNLQFERVVRCSVNPARRVFYDARELLGWIAQVATDVELRRVDEILADG